MILPKDINEYSEEELDEIFKIRTQNSEKHIVPVHVMEIMISRSSKDHPLGISEVVYYLERDYGITMERKAISKLLVQLQEADYLCEMYGKNGFWYDPDVCRTPSIL